MIKSIGGKVFHKKYSFKGTLAVLFYADRLVVAFNKKWF